MGPQSCRQRESEHGNWAPVASSSGRGWQMRLGEDTKLIENYDNSVLYLAPGGRQGEYTPPSSGATTYTSPARFKNDLVKTSSGWTITDHASNTKSVFNSAGRLTSMKDRNEQETKFEYNTTGDKNLKKITSTRGGSGARAVSVTFVSGHLDKLTQTGDNVLGLCFPLVLIVLTVFAGSLANHPAVLVALCGLVGLLTPPLGPAMRFLWSEMTDSQDLKQRAYSMDAVVEESLYMMGPAVAGGIIALASPEGALVLTAALALVGTVGLATSSAARTHAGRSTQARSRVGLGPLRVRPFLSVLVAVVGIGLALGVVEITVAARAEIAGAPGDAGYVLAALAAGSVVGGLAWGRTHHERRRSTQLFGLTSVFALGIAVAGWMPNLLGVAVALFVAGLGLSPAFIVAYIASDELVPPSQRTEATTWVNTVNNFGWSGGAAAAGWMISHSIHQVTFFAGTLMLLLVGAIVLADRRAIK